MIHELFKVFNWLGSEWILLVLFALSVVTVWIALQRYVSLRQLAKASDRFWVEQGETWFQVGKAEDWQGKISELQRNYPCLETESLAVAARARTITAFDAFLESRRLKLERNIGVLGTIGANAPFIGLLGTVLGIIRAFHDMSTQGLNAGMESISTGIAEALVATAIGLCVAIPAVVFFNALNKRVSLLVRRASSVGQFVLGSEKEGN